VRESGAVTPYGIAAIAAVEPGRPAIVCDGVRLTYGELDRRINRFAHLLADRGVGHGDRVSVLLRNRPEVFVVWNAIGRLGAIPVPVSYRFTAAEIHYVVGDSNSVVFVHDADTDSTAVDGLDELRHCIDIDEQRLDDGPSTPPTEDFLGSQVIGMAYTSGTTGRPKGIIRSLPSPTREMGPNPLALFWGFGPDDVHLLCGPAYHTAPGVYSQIHLMVGATVVVMQPFDAARCLELIETERVTTSHMVPANFIRILDVDWQRRDLSSVRKILHAAAPCPPAVKRRIFEVFPPGTVWEYYGMSEGMGTVISPEEWVEKPGSVGRAFPGLDVKIVDDDGKQLAAGEVGTIRVSAIPGYEFGYHNAPDKTAAAWDDGYFTVGDLGWLDDDGYLFIADRRTDLVISGGVNIYPAEVEQAIAEHPAVADVAVFGVPDERMGQTVHAVVELRPGTTCTADDLAVALRGSLADYKLPRSVEFVDVLPREPNGKIRKTELRDAYLR
jgi:long-chain acyl-CoA synthetase